MPLMLPIIALALLLGCSSFPDRVPGDPAGPAVGDDGTTTTEVRSTACIRVHEIWRRQLLVEAAGPSSDSILAALLETVYRPYERFWEGYLGDEAAFLRWIEEEWPLADDRRRLPTTLGVAEAIPVAVERAAERTRRPPACGDWYLVFGPGWTDMGSLGEIGMVVDYLGMSQTVAVQSLEVLLPHEVLHLVFSPTRAGDPSVGTLLDRMIGEGFATWYSVLDAEGRATAAEALGYSESEWAWAREHEFELWELALPHLDSRERDVMNRFSAVRERVLPGAPGKIGYFLGYRIIEAFVERHGPSSWRDLFELPYAAILENSGYHSGPAAERRRSGTSGSSPQSR